MPITNIEQFTKDFIALMERYNHPPAFVLFATKAGDIRLIGSPTVPENNIIFSAQKAIIQGLNEVSNNGGTFSFADGSGYDSGN